MSLYTRVVTMVIESEHESGDDLLAALHDALDEFDGSIDFGTGAPASEPVEGPAAPVVQIDDAGREYVMEGEVKHYVKPFTGVIVSQTDAEPVPVSEEEPGDDLAKALESSLRRLDDHCACGHSRFMHPTAAGWCHSVACHCTKFTPPSAPEGFNTNEKG